MRFTGVLASLAVGGIAIFMYAKTAIPETPPVLAATPPMGWNSWDAYGETVSQTDMAIFNLDDTTQTLRYLWKELELCEAKYKLRDLWEHKNLLPAESLTVTLPPHASVLYRLSNR